MTSDRLSNPSTPENRVPGRSARPTPTAGADRPARPGVDDTDRRIVAALQRDARVSIRSLAQQLHISRANAYARVERLRAEGVITGFTARVAHEKLGLATSAYVSVSIEQNAWRDVSAALRELPGVVHLSLVGAEFDALVQVRAPDNLALRDLVLEQIQGTPGVKATRTWLIFEELEGEGARA